MGDNFRYFSNNFILATAELGASSGTAQLSALIDRNSATTWSSASEGTDGTVSTVTWTPVSAGTIDRLWIKNHNAEIYKVYYNGGTANTFTPDITETGNTGTNSYHEFTAQGITSVTLAITNTITPNEEKYVGEFFCGTQQFEVENNPESYNPLIRKKGYDLEMADGGAKSIWLGEKYHADMYFPYVSTTEIVNFKDLYDNHDSFYFMPTPTESGTDWDGDSWLVNWVGNKDISKLTQGISKTVGYDVNMVIWEISG